LDTDSRAFGLLSEAIAAAAADPSEWPVFLNFFAGATRSNRMSLHRVKIGERSQARYLFICDRTGTFAESKKEELERHYAPRNPLIRPGHRLEACSDETYLKSEFYIDFMRPNDTLQIFGGVIIKTGEASVMLSRSGSHQREPFGDAETRLPGWLMPHLQTAFYLQDRLRVFRDRLRRVKAAFDSTPDAALLIGEGAVVLAANESARRVLVPRPSGAPGLAAADFSRGGEDARHRAGIV
jgi:hypothetical protein